MAPDRSGDVETVESGQPEIQHYQIGPLGSGHGYRTGPVMSRDHIEARLGQIVLHEAGDLQLVVNDEDLRHLLILAPTPTR